MKADTVMEAKVAVGAAVAAMTADRHQHPNLSHNPVTMAADGVVSVAATRRLRLLPLLRFKWIHNVALAAVIAVGGIIVVAAVTTRW
jgi:predicted transcriptional regulator